MSTIAHAQEHASLANSQRAAQDLQNKAKSIDSLQARLLPPQDKEKKLREACEGFETIFVKKMWEEMQATIKESDFLKGRDEKYWKSMYNQELAETLSKAGGIGLADMMYTQLSGNLANATRATVTTSFGGNAAGFELKPVPLFNTTDVEPKNDTSPIRGLAQNIYNSPQNEDNAPKNSPNPMPQNDKSIYAKEHIQPTTPNLEAIRNQSIKNASNSIANMGSKHTNVDANTDNSKVIHNILNQLNNKNNANNNPSVNAQNNAAMQGQNNGAYSANVNNNQQNHVLQPNNNTQPVRANAYREPLVDKLGANAVLPSRTNQAMPRSASRLPEQTNLNQAQVHGNPGISPSKYVHNSPFVVQHNSKNKTSNGNNGQIASAANAMSTTNSMNTANNYEAALIAAKANTNAQIDANANNNAQIDANANNNQMTSRPSTMQNQGYIPINSQNNYMGQGQNIQQGQSLNVLPSQRKNNTI